MKKKIRVTNGRGEYVEKEIQYIPVRYILAMMITILEVVMVIGLVFLFAYYIPYFYLAIYATVIGVVISIIVSYDNPDYKVPWLLFVITVPIVGFMCYFLFYRRKLTRKMIRKFKLIEDSYTYDDSGNHKSLREEDKLISSQALELTNIASSSLYRNTKLKYFSMGEYMHESILEDLKRAEKFVFLEYFIIEEGIFWNSMLDILLDKVSKGVVVKVVYDDIGCMTTLPGNYHKILRNHGIEAVPFSRLKGQADNEFNNRSHRKILVIDGHVGYTGGINIADEYINIKEVYGKWKYTGIRLEGEAVNELTKLFLSDYYINVNRDGSQLSECYSDYSVKSDSYVIPFGDGPNPIYDHNVGKTVIMNMLSHATDYVYITTPYLIIDNELMKAIENASLRGVDVRIIVPHIPDKKLVFMMTKSNYQILMKSGVKIYEYAPGFIHAKSYLCDDKVGMIGTINLDYRSLTHHFENGVWIYNDKCLLDMKRDFENTIKVSMCMNKRTYKDNLVAKLIRSIVRIFSPLL